MSKNTNLAVDPRRSRRARGLRLKSIRKSLQLSRKAFSDRFSISTYTVQNWETNKNGGLTKARARDVLEWLKQAGVECTFAWLIYGVAPAPIFSDPILGEISLEQPIAHDLLVVEDKELRKIAEELNLFRQHYPNKVLDMIVPDDAMEPFYSKGDYVAGIKQTGHEIEKLIEQDCIVLTSENEWLVRQLKKGNSPKHYNLISANPSATSEGLCVDHVEIEMAAAIVWIRKNGNRTLLCI